MSNKQYDEITITLDKSELDNLNQRYPKENKNIEGRAIELVKIYLKKTHRNIEIKEINAGSDLKIILNKKESFIEVKGTKSDKIKWGQIKVSSPESHKDLLNGTPLYRVFDVFGKEPKLAILKCERDFTMKPEPRWSVSPKKMSKK